MPEIRQGCLEDCYLLAPMLRAADAAEVKALANLSPEEALVSSFEASRERFTITHEGKPIAIYGGGPHPNDPTVGIPWMLGSDGIKHHWVWFLRHTPEIVWSVQQHYPVLWNLVDVRNTVHIRWLKWCGFTFGRVHDAFGYEQRPFQEFVRYRECAG